MVYWLVRLRRCDQPCYVECYGPRYVSRYVSRHLSRYVSRYVSRYGPCWWPCYCAWMSSPLSPPKQHATWKLVLAYDGTDFAGWQVQPGLATVQGSLAAAVRSVTGENVLPQGAGRTDAGVHAEGQAVSLRLVSPIPEANLRRALNRVLPVSLRVLSAEVVHDDFHARARVASKTYRYRIFPLRFIGSADEALCDPRRARWVWQCSLPLQIEAMQAATVPLIGTHDFTSFAANDPDRASRALVNSSVDNVRTITRCEWSQTEQEMVFEVEGPGFLHHMVRNLVGTMVEIGSGRWTIERMGEILKAQDRSAAGPTAPPEGLSLVRVVYRNVFDREEQG